MRPLSFLLRGRPLPVLAREAMWRVQRRVVKSRRLAQISAGECPVQFRYIRLHKLDPGTLTDHAKELAVLAADHVRKGNFPLLGYEGAALGFPPQWNIDFVSGKDWPVAPSPELTLVRHDGSDVKVPWELSRLQYAPVLAKAHQITGKKKYRDAACALISDWIATNPPCTGVNWTVAMEAALRGISICFTADLLWPFDSSEREWLTGVQRSLWQHLLFIEGNLEFSNVVCGNHYLSNVVGLLVLSLFLDGPAVLPRRHRYLRALEAEMQRQVYADGGNFEASSGYHLLVLHMFATAELVMRAAGVASSSAYQQRLRMMFAYLAALCDEQGRAPQFGDCDDGRVFLTVDDLERLMRPPQERDSMICACMLGVGAAMFGLPSAFPSDDAAWFGLSHASVTEKNEPPRVQVYAESGVAVARRAPATVTFLNMPNGIKGKGSHTHNDKLSVVVRLFGEDLLVDSGTGVYTRDISLRNTLRATASHNTVQIDGCEQNTIDTSKHFVFCLGDEAVAAPILADCNDQNVTVRSALLRCSVPGVQHHRTVKLSMQADNVRAPFEVEDRLLGDGQHDFTLFWNIGPRWKVTNVENSDNSVNIAIAGRASVRLCTVAPCAVSGSLVPAQISYAYGVLTNSQRIVISGRCQFPASIRTELRWAETPSSTD